MNRRRLTPVIAFAAATVIAAWAGPRISDYATGKGANPGALTGGEYTVPEAPETPQQASQALDQLASLHDVSEPAGGYQRAAFGDGWNYDPGTGCNTRELVLLAESTIPATADARCRPTGAWLSLYDGLRTTDVADLQIDHLVPLANAWATGAASWSPTQRVAYANDLTHPNALIAVTGSTNEAKGAQDPASWLPPAAPVHCWYATAWVAQKAAWALGVTPPERAALADLLTDCAKPAGS